ncbi:ead/Ea22-like family protein [Escherichia coli]|nr:ead/Ea22-like family protein [Escherichia coli]
MREINYQALRAVAGKATKGSYIVGHTSVNQHGNLTGVFVCQKWKGEPGGVIAECHVNCLVETDAQAYANAEFIAEANPATVLALLDELESAKKRIAELESRTVKLPEAFRLAKSSNVLMYYYADEVNAALAAADIRIKGEDHGNKIRR